MVARKQVTIVCKRCERSHDTTMTTRYPLYCDECKPIAERERKNRSNALSLAARKRRQSQGPAKPRLIPYAGFDKREQTLKKEKTHEQ